MDDILGWNLVDGAEKGSWRGEVETELDSRLLISWVIFVEYGY